MSYENNALLLVNVHKEACWAIYYLVDKFSLIEGYRYRVNYGFFLMNMTIIKVLLKRTLGDQR